MKLPTNDREGGFARASVAQSSIEVVHKIRARRDDLSLKRPPSKGNLKSLIVGEDADYTSCCGPARCPWVALFRQIWLLLKADIRLLKTGTTLERRAYLYG